MVDTAYCQLCARYNRWMNERLYAAVAPLPDAERKRDRGAFFGSIHRTLSHLLWADRAWLARFGRGRCDVPAYGADMYDDFATLARERDVTDTEILNWAGQLSADWLASTLTYARAADRRTVSLPAWIAATHFFNHSTHHRGQVTTLLAQAGVEYGPTDLPWLPGLTTFVES
jgi:uncharacterized damage-inducible protein DinB